MKLVKQIEVRNNKGELLNLTRYDSENELLYVQNRSKDCIVPIDEYLTSLSGFLTKAKEIGNSVKVYEVGVNSKWIQN